MGLVKDLFSFGSGEPGRLLPPDAPAILESFGRHEGPAPGGDMVAGLNLGRTVRDALVVDPERVLDEIVEACDSVGGWSYYGAWDILSAYAADRQEDPRYVHVVDGLLDKLEEEGYGPGDIPMGLTPRAIERQRAERAARPATESVPEPEPDIPPLADGERRLLQVVDRPDGNQNKIYLIRRRPSDNENHQFVTVIHYSEATDFDFDTELVWHGGSDERAVYIRVAEAYANTRTASCGYWLEPDVKWFADRVG
jgi:hypothetical protein